ncbi:HYM1 [[Candida] subhashii]|uniref:HYM1 n=1 Tax=[Candida] subhashii TaxID=561895 RepID=A0A8J5QEN8_9ASCO|nr:HYM1 [[Candida] subhashii]KAG7660547.1 HYM1 [[Candida] subhashii]
MAFLFKRDPKTPKTPQDLVRALTDSVQKLDINNDNNKKYQDDCARYLNQMKIILHGDDENDPQPDQITLLAQEVHSGDCLYHLIYNLRKLDFDSRKDVVILFSTLLRRQIGTTSNKSSPTAEYLVNNKPNIILMLMKGPESHEIGLICGQILRDCIKYENINRFILYHPTFWNFFKYVQIPIFEIATDSFTTLHDLLTSHKKLVAEFLATNYDTFIIAFNKLIQSNNYVTKRQSVKLLNDLLKKQNQTFLNKYFDDINNLKLIMLILSDKSKNLQREGFHVFKFFVVNPRRSQKVLDILVKNKENFIEFFNTFDIQGFHDPTLANERDYVLEQIKNLPDIERIH